MRRCSETTATDLQPKRTRNAYHIRSVLHCITRCVHGYCTHGNPDAIQRQTPSERSELLNNKNLKSDSQFLEMMLESLFGGDSAAETPNFPIRRASATRFEGNESKEAFDGADGQKINGMRSEETNFGFHNCQTALMALRPVWACGRIADFQLVDCTAEEALQSGAVN